MNDLILTNPEVEANQKAPRIDNQTEADEEEEATNKSNTSCFKECKKVSPLLMVSGAGLIFSVLALLSKKIPVPAGLFVSCEGGFNLTLCLMICFYLGVDVSPFSITHNQGWFWGRVLLGGLAAAGKIVVMRHMNIGDATAIIFSAPIWAGCLARVLLREKYTIVNLFSTVVGLVGILLVTKPAILFPDIADQGESSLSWAIATLAVSLIAALSYVCVRGAGDTVHPLKFVLYTAVVESVCGFLVTVLLKDPFTPPPCHDWVRGTLVACGYGATLGNVLINMGLALENSGPATLMRNWDIIYAYVFQVVFFDTSPDWIGLLGAGLIVFTALLIGLDKIFNISRGIQF